ncbi:C39 family peptidase [Pseudomonas gingeri]|uniref:C39 family peptidase n=1 Tax=Pseudomonas gingeri TaxID=117681 RepID=UPI0034E98A25
MLLLSLFSDQAVATGPTLRSMSQLKMQGIQRQTLDYSCGAAALSLLLNRYLDDPVTEAQILADIVLRLPESERLERVTDGFSMLDLKSVAENLGYTADGVLLPPQAVHALKGPVIILLRRKQLNHFVVLKGVGQGRAFLADPARGHLRMPLHQLLREWQGETLMVSREGFGLPDQHPLGIPARHYLSPETDTVRILQGLSRP